MSDKVSYNRDLRPRANSSNNGNPGKYRNSKLAQPTSTASISSFFNKPETDPDQSKPPTYDKDKSDNGITIPIPVLETNGDDSTGFNMLPPNARYKKDTSKDVNNQPKASNGANTPPFIEDNVK